MTFEQLNVTLSLITTFSAIIAPTITTIINNRHQRKMKDLDIRLNKKHEIYQEYVSLLNLILTPEHPSPDLIIPFMEAHAKVYLICNPDLRHSLFKLHYDILEFFGTTDREKIESMRKQQFFVIDMMRNEIHYLN